MLKTANTSMNTLQVDGNSLHDLLNQQVPVVSATIENFDKSLRQLYSNEERIQTTIKSINKAINTIQEEAYGLLEDVYFSVSILHDLIDHTRTAILLAKAKILDTSILERKKLLEELGVIAASSTKTVVPITPNDKTLPFYISIIDISACQLNKNIIFVLKVSLVDPKQYTLYHFYSLPAPTKQDDLFSTITPISDVMAISDDNTQMFYPYNCKTITDNDKICYTGYLQTINEDSQCEIQQIIHSGNYGMCQPHIIKTNEVKLQKLYSTTKWLLFIPKTINIVERCPEKETNYSKLSISGSITLEHKCNLFVGIFQLSPDVLNTSTAHNIIYLPSIEFDCCEDSITSHLEDIPYLKLQHLSLDNLNEAKSHLTDIKNTLDNMKKPFLRRHIPWVAYNYIRNLS
ncbi:hypothetical protein ILUMI_17335 [Ignelater luminosus]|uniref:Envelope fusion protein n=1 Tax=Ignelater luminosus TaxID=2038154 RepID=A0A8K0G809_IGNLU|nr:hypothetical protein ILUMI_17335 [Ignelater luminosus]